MSQENETSQWNETFQGNETSGWPACVDISCPPYWKNVSLTSWVMLVARVTIALFILALGFKMPKDFMRSITVTVFIPILFMEVFSVYMEVGNFLQYFAESPEAMAKMMQTYFEWTSTFLYLIYDYVHYNCIVMMILLLHCCRLATKPGDNINLFPINTICMVLQIIPFFFSIIIYIEQDAIHTSVLVISVLSRVITILGFIVIFLQIIFALPLTCRQLPYDHAAIPDLQLQDARSRLAWTLVYAIIPFYSLLPFVVEAVAWISVMGKTDDPLMILVRSTTEILKYLVNYFRLNWLVILTVLLLPPYRRATILLFTSCPCCPRVKVDAIPRRPKDTSNMYKHAA